jgi:hypothetical protein
MSHVSFSRITTYTNCPHKYKLQYIDGLETVFDCEPQNALVLGTAMHECVELGVDRAVENYIAQYPVLTDAIIDETIKLKCLGQKLENLVYEYGDPIFEVECQYKGFLGYLDALVPAQNDHEWILFDFKYSNHTEKYAESPQIAIYKWLFEHVYPDEKIVSAAYICVPKTQIRQKKTEDQYQFRQRLLSTLDDMQPQMVWVDCSEANALDTYADAIEMLQADDFPKVPTKLCDWCDYQEFCEKGNDMMVLPKNERRAEEPITKPDMWIYADSYVGKSTFVDHMDNVLFINTDGNVSNITSPYILIADELHQEGRITSKTLAWENFISVIDQLERHDNTFEVVALDLVEDLYEHCRTYIFNQLGIKHETDAGYGKGWDMVRTEFLRQMKRLKTLGYQVIYISKEVVNEITYASGAKVSTFRPNIPDKIANVLAGTVTLTLRAYMDERGRYLNLRKAENIFGGGRIDFKRDACALDVEDFANALAEAQSNINSSNRAVAAPEHVVEDVKEVVTHAVGPVEVNAYQGDISITPNLVDAVQQAAEEVKKPVRRTRKPRA